MAVKLRLARHGAKRKPIYRIVAAENKARRDGRFLDLIGTYNPNVNPPVVSLKRDRIAYWLGEGAQPTKTVKSLFQRHLAGTDTLVVPKTTYVPTDAPAPVPKKAEAAPAAAPAPAADPAPAPATAAAPAAESDAS